ncbi:aldehyde dehydrogenase [Salmonella enterica subsp. enterica]|uniref:Aldehyde dehydrogenase n=1 Tax=Salmonella enterica I TaxID=59201 RepID=A0A3S4I331_SALET|nr:aldehyde dehydrogenase [Salmonella enterica subsp. enterica]
MNTSELETLIRTILSEQLTTPAQTPVQPQGKGDFPVRERGHRRRAPGVLTLSAVPAKNPQRHYQRDASGADAAAGAPGGRERQ